MKRVIIPCRQLLENRQLPALDPVPGVWGLGFGPVFLADSGRCDIPTRSGVVLDLRTLGPEITFPATNGCGI